MGCFCTTEVGHPPFTSSCPPQSILIQSKNATPQHLFVRKTGHSSRFHKTCFLGAPAIMFFRRLASRRPYDINSDEVLQRIFEQIPGF